MIKVCNLNVCFGNRQVIQNLNWTVPTNTTVGLRGANGSGKSTLLNAIKGTGTFTSGRVDLYKTPTEIFKSNEGKYEIGYMGGAPLGFYPRLSGKENLEFFSYLYHLAPTDRDLKSILERVGLTDAADKNYHQYSLGMRQRLHLGRLIMHPGRFCLLDEPTNGLDDQGKTLLVDVLGSELRRRTTIIASHDLEFLEKACSSIFVIDSLNNSGEIQ